LRCVDFLNALSLTKRETVVPPLSVVNEESL
jgi:hypothetical protein